MKERVLSTYKAQDAKNEENFQSDLKAAMAYDKKIKSGGSRWESKGPAKESHLRESWLIGNKASGASATGEVKAKKESGTYSSSPVPQGGTKKMIRISRRNVRKNDASPQAKRSAKKLY